MKKLLVSAAAVLCLSVLGSAGLSWHVTQPEVPEIRTRIALGNLAHVIKEWDKSKAYQAEVKDDVKGYLNRAEEMTAELELLEKRLKSDNLPEEKRDELDKALRKGKGKLDEFKSGANRSLAKKQEKQIVELYG